MERPSSFQSHYFQAWKVKLAAASRMCICKKCMNSYGFCNLFEEHVIMIYRLKQISLRSSIAAAAATDDDDNKDNEVINFLDPGKICCSK